MKSSWLWLLTAGAGLAGYVFGAFTDPAPVSTVGSAPVGAASSPSATAQGATLLAKSPFSAVFAALKVRTSLQDLTRLDDALSQLDPAQFPNLLAAIIGSPSIDRWKWLSLVLAKWFERDPQAAAKWVLAKVDRFQAAPEFGKYDPDHALLQLLARYRPDDALALARRLAEKPAGEKVLVALTQTWPAERRAELLQLLQSFPEGGPRAHAVSKLFQIWGQEDPMGALASVRSYPAGGERNEALYRALHGLAKSDPKAALDQLGSDAGPDAVIVQSAILSNLRSSPLAADWLKRHEDAPASISSHLVSLWAEEEPAAALDWAQAHGLSLLAYPTSFPKFQGAEERDSFGDMEESHYSSPPIYAAFQNSPKEATAWLRQQDSGPELDALISAALTRTSGTSPEAEKELFAKLTPEAQVYDAHRFVNKYSEDPAAAQAWIQSLPAGPVREAAWEGYGNTFAKPVDLPPGPDRDALLDSLASKRGSSPEQAWSWIQQIEDPARRRDTFDAMMWGQLHEGSPERAAKVRDFLNNGDVPAKWKQAWSGNR